MYEKTSKETTLFVRLKPFIKFKNEARLLAVEKNRDSDDQREQRDAVSNKVDRIRDHFGTSVDRRLANVSTEAVIAVAAPITVHAAPTARVLCK
ncbi:hypothetical protein K0M31_011414 [Melipona bicolor]|uniref:Uncharacterized protein n=1 Tax=Melipona bicolor TaxID=60889 RepID=A0AA40KUR7_9HYME|nr:hypothetical protein K0M31_011414 [Melipona bicolor]